MPGRASESRDDAGGGVRIERRGLRGRQIGDDENAFCGSALVGLGEKFGQHLLTHGAHVGAASRQVFIFQTFELLCGFAGGCGPCSRGCCAFFDALAGLVEQGWVFE